MRNYQSRTPSMSKEEAIQLHAEALVIDAQQPPATTGFLFNSAMQAELERMNLDGYTREEAHSRLLKLAANEIQNQQSAMDDYFSVWDSSGITVGAGTYAGGNKIETAFEDAVTLLAQARSIIDASNGKLILVRKASDIELAYKNGIHGLIMDFQDTLPYGTDLDRIDMFHNLGIRQVQLTYNLRNLVGDGCTEANPSGISYFGREVVERLNELNSIVDVSHCSESVGWDAIQISSSPVIISHSTAKAISIHDRAKSDELARAIADQGGFFGVAVVPGFLQDESYVATLDQFVDHVIHLIDVMGIEHVGVGNDKCGKGPQTGTLIEFPEEMPIDRFGDFDWIGFREEHRVHGEYRMEDYQTVRDWPNITVKLAERGFNEAEIRKLLGLNYLRVFREIVG